jgi:hypothetical protein
MTDQQEHEIQGTEPQRLVKRKPLRPFGADKSHELMVKQEALRTMTRQQAFDRGYLTVKELDDEELRYGRCRDENGYIPKSGKRTRLIPEDKYDAMIAEHELRFKQKLRQNLDDMLDIMVEIAKDDCVEPRDRFEAAKYIFERTAGKTPEKLDVTVKAAPWEEMLGQVTGIAPMSRAEHRALQGAGIVDVEVVEDSDGEDIQSAEDQDDSTQHNTTTEAEAQDPVQPSQLSQDGPPAPIEDVVQVHIPRPHERYRDTPDELPGQQQENQARQGTRVGQEPNAGEQYDEHVPLAVGPDVLVRPNNSREQPEPGQRVDEPDDATQYLDYGGRRTQNKSYADQVRAAEDLAKRRKEHRERIQQAKKQRKINRVTGADAIETDITGATVGDDGQITFD